MIFERVKNENVDRKKKYSKNLDEENFLERMNLILQSEEQGKYKDYSIQYPFIFIFGVPRSGTTLLTQLVAKNLNVGFFNNLSSRFWLAPLHGIKLSKSVIGNNFESNYSSEFGRTTDVSEPHEFGYFWHYWLKMENEKDFVHPGINENIIDWQDLKTVLANIQHEFDLPIMMKNFFGVNYFEQINNLSKKFIWLYIKRDLIDSAISIYKARMNYYGNISKWWSTKPPQYFELKEKNGLNQIAGQVFYLNEYYNRLLKKYPDRVVEIKYKDLCKNPKSVFDYIIKRISDSCNYNISYRAKLPDEFDFSTYDKSKFPEIVKEFRRFKEK